MKKKILLVSALMTLIVLVSLCVISNKDYIMVNNSIILVNSEALASECAPGEVSGSAYTVTCGTPIGDKGKKCTYSVVTCQGSSNCCTRNYCSSHMN